MASLSLQHITKRYPNGFEAVKDFNLEIADKEFIIFVGPSGCNTEPIIRVYSEASTMEAADEIGKQIMDIVYSLAK